MFATKINDSLYNFVGTLYAALGWHRGSLWIGLNPSLYYITARPEGLWLAEAWKQMLPEWGTEA